MSYKGQNTSKVHVWVGNNYNKDYYNYFELDYSDPDMDIYDPEYKICGFCKDIDEKWYDEDWLGSFQHSQLVDLNELLKELSVSEEILAEIKRTCIKKGFKQANAMFWYYDGNIVVKDKEKLYNELTYIGMFDTTLGNRFR